MKIKFAVIVNNLSGDELVKTFDELLAKDFNKIGGQAINLSDLIGIGRMPEHLADWTDYEKIIIICNSATAIFFFDVYRTIEKAELWVINWPKEIAGSDRPDKHKFFDQIPRMVEKAKELLLS
ncbi:MAG: hypothetical protein WC608_04350 [Parcubacteria group bacterium]